MTSIYIAGPDLFFRDTWTAHCARVAALCKPLGLTPVFPVPPVPITGPGVTSDADPAAARPIYESCLRAIRESDAVLANLTPFRGWEPDAGTVWEAATAKAIGKTVVAYILNRKGGAGYTPPHRPAPDGAWVDKTGAAIERFGFPINVMSACGVDLLVTTTGTLDPLAEGLRHLRLMTDRCHANDVEKGDV